MSCSRRADHNGRFFRTLFSSFSILAKPHQLHRRFRLAGETMAGETPLVSPAALHKKEQSHHAVLKGIVNFKNGILCRSI